MQLNTGHISAFDGFVKRAREILRDFGAERFDYLVNNAGTSNHASIDKMTEAELDDLYNVHFKGVFFLTQKLLPLINDGGRIVNISTGLTRITIPGSFAYASMKGAIEYLTRALSPRNWGTPHCRQHGRSRRNRDRLQRRLDQDNPEMNKRVSEMTALGRAGVPEDIGPMIASLLSEDDRWINAQRIEVSGGMAP